MNAAVADPVEVTFEYLENLYQRPITPAAQAGLRRTETLMRLLDNPHRSFPSVHITGTCGKGSTATMVGSILESTGFKTGIFRSPHLETYRERIAVGSGMISADEWVAVFETVHASAEAMEAGRIAGYDLGRVSLFEFVFAMAALHFARCSVQFGVVEVGIGGRLDPTNVIASEVAVVTNVSLDHTALLGPSEADIAREKSKIIKTGCFATSAATQPEVVEIIRDRAHETGSKLWLVGEDVQFSIESHDRQGERFAVRTPASNRDGLSVGLLGDHQVVNAATAVSVVGLLRERGFEVDVESVVEGLAKARFPGRCEVVSEDPLVVLDGARNVASALVLRMAVEELFAERHVVLLLGILGDKDAEGIVDVLAPMARQAIVTEPPYEGRRSDPDRLLQPLQTFLDSVAYESEIERALDVALAALRPDDLLLVTGSLYLVGAVRSLLLGHEPA